MQQLADGMRNLMEAGLRGAPDCPLKMIPTFITNMPTGKEEGPYYALDS